MKKNVAKKILKHLKLIFSTREMYFNYQLLKKENYYLLHFLTKRRTN